MKIAIDIRKIGKKGTGSETYFYYLVKELAGLEGSKEHEFYLLTDGRASEAKKNLGSLPENFKIYTVTPTAKFLWTFYSLPRFLRKNFIDVLHVEYVIPFHIKKNIKIVTTIHDISFRVNPDWITKKDGFILNSLIPPSLKRADAVIAVSDFTKKEISKYYNIAEDKIFVTHPAVDYRYYSSISKKKAYQETTELLGKKVPFILHLSSLQPRKNVPLIISAFAKLKRGWMKNNSEWKDTKLVIVGDKNGYNYDGKIDEILKQFQDDLGENGVIITGYQPEKILPCFYKAALVFVFPSSYEGFGIPLLEAMASETPVVASDIAVFREVAGDAAIYVDIDKKDKEEKLKIAIRRLLEDKKLRYEKIKSGLERKDIFSWKKLAESTLEVYKNICKF